jgi:hypothetical protein
MGSMMYSNRILSKGVITDLSNGFSLGGIPFSVYLRKKTISNLNNDALLNCRLICDKDYCNSPVPIGDWSPEAIVSIAPDAIDLDEYELYWGAGETI